MSKPMRTCPLRTVCGKAGVPRKHADALFQEILEATFWGQAVSIPGMGKFWLQEYPQREIRIPLKRGSRSVRPVTTGPSFALRFTSTEGLRKYLRIRNKARARGTW